MLGISNGVDTLILLSCSLKLTIEIYYINSVGKLTKSINQRAKEHIDVSTNPIIMALWIYHMQLRYSYIVYSNRCQIKCEKVVRERATALTCLINA
jgi:hypothetical protein